MAKYQSSAALIVLILTAFAASALDLSGIDNGDLLACIVPNSNGSIRTLLTAEEELIETQKIMQELAEEPEPTVDFYLYTQHNRKEPQQIFNTKESIDASHYDSTKDTRIFIHGWMGSLTFPSNKPVLNAWLKTGDYNIIMIDWSHLAMTFNTLKIRLSMPSMANTIAQLLLTLNQNYALSYENLHVVGHSMGAHLAGFVGKRIIQLGHKIGTIVGLDTSSSCVSYSKTEGRLASTDATYVESIHASSPFTGFRKPIGLASFYVNGAGSQDMCHTTMWSSGAFYMRWVQASLKSLCSHMLATNFYAQALLCQSSIGHSCDDYQNALKGNCEHADNDAIKMGALRQKGSDNLANTPAGLYYVEVDRSFNVITGQCERSAAAYFSISWAVLILGYVLSKIF